MKAIHLGALTLLGAIWGASFIFIRLGAHEFGPLALIAIRVAIASLILWAYLIAVRDVPDLRQRWLKYLIVGTLNAAMPFVLIAYAQLSLSASFASILNSTTPLFTAIVASVWIGEKMTLPKIAGVVLGIIGVALLTGGSEFTITDDFLAIGASLGAALCYGLGTVYSSKYLTGNRPLHNALGQMLGATAFLALPAAVNLPETMPSQTAIFALLALATLSTAFAYQLYFYLINHVGATRTATVTFLVPMFGTLWGVLFLKETFTLSMLLGMLVILASVGLVIGANFRKMQTA